MSRVHIDADKLDRLADAVGAKSGVPLKLTIDGMVDAVLSIEEGITPTGTKHITFNGEHDVAEFATASVAVEPNLQSKTAIPSANGPVTVTPDDGYDGLSAVTVLKQNNGRLTVEPSSKSQDIAALDRLRYFSRNLSISGSQVVVQVDTSGLEEGTEYSCYVSLTYWDEYSETVESGSTYARWTAFGEEPLYDGSNIAVVVGDGSITIVNKDPEITGRMLVDVHVGYDGYGRVVVDPIPIDYVSSRLQDKTATPSREQQRIVPDGATVSSIHAVTTSSGASAPLGEEMVVGDRYTLTGTVKAGGETAALGEDFTWAVRATKIMDFTLGGTKRSISINPFTGTMYTSNEAGMTVDIELRHLAYSGLSSVTVEAIPSEYATVEPLSVTANGTYTAPTGHAYSPVTVNVEGGGGGGGSMSDPIRFFDYDGTLVASYTAVPAELPDVPTHEGLVDGTWNYTLADVQEQFAAMGTCDVGANYSTESGATEIDVVFDDPNIRSPYLAIAVNGTITVDWGDGSPTGTMTGSSYTTLVFLRHEYAETGAYTISISGPFAFYSTSGSRGSVLKEDTSTSSNRYLYANCIREIRLGTNASIKSYAFSASTKLAAISIPTSLSVTTSSDRMFSTCFSLKFAAIPRGSTGCPQYGFQSCYELAAVSLPITVTTIPMRAFYYCSHLSSVSIPKNVNSLGNECFRLCASLTRIVTPPGISHIPQYMCHSCGNIASIRVMGLSQSQGAIQTYAFYGLNVLTHVDLPAETKTIGEMVFSNCYSIDTLHIRATNPPTIYSNTFNSSMYNTAKIYVPYSADHSILEAYKTASVWKNYASRMVEEPQS